MRSPFRRFMDFIVQPPHDVLPSIQSFQEINCEKLKADLQPDVRGGERGTHNEPASDTRDLDTVEQEILHRIDAQAKADSETFTGEMQTYTRRLGNISLEGYSGEIRGRLRVALADFMAEVHHGRDELHSLRRQVIDLDDDYSRFRRRHRISHSADYPASRVLHWSILLLLMIGEGILNGLMLKRGLEGGLVAGVGIAFAISVVNVGFLGLFLGSRGLRWLYHRSWVFKLGGVAMLLLAAAAAITGNLGVAHYRDLLAGDSPELAGRLAVEALRHQPFDIADIVSWALCVLGIFFFLLAAADGFKMDDPYPGYGRLARRRDQSHEAYVSTKKELLDDLEDIRDESLAAVRKAKESLQARSGERATILQARRDKQKAFLAQMLSLESCANSLLLAYRDENRRRRSTPPPAHFAQRWTLARPAEAEIVTEKNWDDRQIQEEIRKTIEALDRANEKINAAYEEATVRYSRIEQLTGEEIANAAAAQTAA